MLKVYFGDMPGTINNTSLYFDNTYLDSWVTGPFAEKIIKDLDKGEVFETALGSKAVAVINEEVDVIPVTWLSSSTKTVLLIQNEPDKIFDISRCCEESARFILEVAEEKDIVVSLNCAIDFGGGHFEIEILNSHTVVHNMEEFLVCMGESMDFDKYQYFERGE